MARPRSRNNLENQLLARFRAGAEGRVFASVEFLDLGNRAAVDQALARLCRAGEVKRARRGLYHLPGKTHWFGKLGATPDAVAQAIARRDGLRIQEGGAYAANHLRLTEQVPARIIYDTDGPSRKVKLGGKSAINPAIVDRYYLTRGIRRIGEAFEIDRDHKVLVVQATGGGKTRMVIALADLLVRCNWAKRIRFLADQIVPARAAGERDRRRTRCFCALAGRAGARGVQAGAGGFHGRQGAHRPSNRVREPHRGAAH